MKYRDAIILGLGSLVLLGMAVAYFPTDAALAAWSWCMLAGSTGVVTTTCLLIVRAGKQSHGQRRLAILMHGARGIVAAVLVVVTFVLSQKYPFLLPTFVAVAVGVFGGFPLGRKKVEE